ncbi:MAG: DUF4199 domain-containing protein [Rikenellaceae bacterium]
MKFWNDAAKWGLLIGIIMGASRILEYGMMLTGSVSNYALLTFEYVIVAVVYGVLLYQAVRCRAVEIYEKEGFLFGRSVNYALIVSIFASVVVAAISYVYINSVVGGYDIYLERLVASVTKVMDEVEVDASIKSMYAESFNTLQSTQREVPSIFDTLISAMSMYIIAGTAVGVVVSLFVKRYIKKNFDNEQAN